MSVTKQEALEQRLALLETEMARLRDQMAIYQLLASYAPAVDSCQEEATAALWTPEGRYDYGDKPLVGARDVGALVNLDTHKGYVEAGCAHVISMHKIDLDGDSAVATGYARIYLHSGNNWDIVRVTANRWELVRTDAGWKIQNRTNRVLDGSPEARALLMRGSTSTPSQKAMPRDK